MTFRSDHDAARIRGDELVIELARERAKTAATMAKLEAQRSERKRLEAALPRPRWIPRWRDSSAIDVFLIGLLWITALLFLFAVLYVPRVLVEGRW